MPDLEDVDIRFVYYKTSAMEVFFLKAPKLTETQAMPTQTFLRLDQNATVLPHVVELAINDNNWPQANTHIKRPERGKPQNNNSTQRTTNMGSHTENQKPEKAYPDALSRLKKRERLCKITSKRRQESNNNQQDTRYLIRISTSSTKKRKTRKPS